MAERYLCVGGPMDGQIYASREGAWFIVESQRPSLDAPPDAVLATDTQLQPPRVTYRLETFSTPEGAAHVWIPEGQPLLQTMTMLCEGYSPKRPKQ